MIRAKWLKAELERVEDSGLKGQSCSAGRPSGAVGVSLAAQVAMALDDTAEELNRAIPEETAALHELYGGIKLPDETQQAVLVYRYLCGKPWDAVAKNTGIANPNALKAHREALMRIEKACRTRLAESAWASRRSVRRAAKPWSSSRAPLWGDSELREGSARILRHFRICTERGYRIEGRAFARPSLI